MAKPIHVLNGANLNLIGTRGSDIWGDHTLAQIERRCEAAAKALGHTVVFRSSNEPADLIDWVQRAEDEACGVVLNPGAYWDIFPALTEAASALSIPIVEAHLSVPYASEWFKDRPYVTVGRAGVVMGFGPVSYELALKALADILAR